MIRSSRSSRSSRFLRASRARRPVTVLAATAVLAFALPAHAAVKVLACEPEWGALAKELGGDLVDVSVATSAMQDPHQIQAKPSLIARTRNADLVACTGSELEIGWLPVLLQQAGNPKVQPGQPGNFSAADFVRKLDVPTSVDRSQGDIHPGGNPHIQTDPRNIALVATALGARLALVDPPHAADYQKRTADFQARWSAAMTRWTAQAAPLKGLSIAAHHKAYVYMENWLGLTEVAVLEPKPGVEPSAAHLQEVLATLKTRPAKMVVYSAYQDPKPDEWLSANAGIPAVKLPFTVGGTDGAKDLFGLFDDTLSRLTAAAAGKK
jgi:zinc/manganese transport system substrate-binding protein